MDHVLWDVNRKVRRLGQAPDLLDFRSRRYQYCKYQPSKRHAAESPRLDCRSFEETGIRARLRCSVCLCDALPLLPNLWPHGDSRIPPALQHCGPLDARRRSSGASGARACQFGRRATAFNRGVVRCRRYRIATNRELWNGIATNGWPTAIQTGLGNRDGGWKRVAPSRMLEIDRDSCVPGQIRSSNDMSETSPQTVERTESTLVTAAKAGDYDAFEQLVNRYEHKIYRLGLNITGNPEDAEDVLQETFLKAFENLPRFREDSRFYTWIVRIGVNQALMKLRKRRTDKSVSLDDPIEESGEIIPRDFADWAPNPEQQLGRTETREIMERAIQNLPVSFRTVFQLRDVEGLSTEETAEMLGLTISAVKARLFRARLRLREDLAKFFKRG